MVLIMKGLINKAHLHWKLHFSNEISGLYSKGGLNFMEVFIAELYCIQTDVHTQAMINNILKSK